MRGSRLSSGFSACRGAEAVHVNRRAQRPALIMVVREAFTGGNRASEPSHGHQIVTSCYYVNKLKSSDAYANKRYAEVAPLIKRVAEANHLDGMAIRGVMYLYGKGMERDGRKAEVWLSRAAEAGQVSAQSILGMMYATGAGVPKNPQKSSEMVVQSGWQGGGEHAIQMLDLLSRDADTLRL